MEILLVMSKLIYDFDDFSLFLLDILINLPDNSSIRYSSSGKTIHVETDADLSAFEDQRRLKWSKYYGRLTFLRKNNKIVGDWIDSQKFIKEYYNYLLRVCINNVNKYGKIQRTERKRSICKSKSKTSKNTSRIKIITKDD